MVKAVVCGTGFRGLEHAQILQQVAGIELKGVYDIAFHSRQQAESLLSIPTFSDLATLLRETSPELIVIATPPQIRLSLIEQIAQQNCVRAIVVEKPFALTLAEATKIVEIAHERGILLAVGHQLRFSEEFIALKQAIAQNKIGQLQSLQAFCYGNLFDQGSHMVDLLQWLVEGQTVNWVMAQSCDNLAQLAKFKEISSEFNKDTRHPAPLWLNATLGFSGGLQASLYCGLLNVTTQPELGEWLQKRIVAIGTQGVAEAHSASHFKLLTSESAGWQLQTTGMASYYRATLALHQHIVKQLQANTSFNQEIPEALQSLQVIIACLESVAQGNLVSLPLSVEQNSLPEEIETNSLQKPIVSIIVAMEDHRGMGLDMARSWVEKQRCNPNDYEIIVIIDKTTQDLEVPLTKILRPQDLLINQSASSEMEQYDIGARHAKGQFFFFTEPHCIAEPEAVKEILHYIATHTDDGFCVRSTPICPNQIGKMESHMYDDGFLEWSKPDSWIKVIIRGFGIRRDVYLASGGFDYYYSRFSEWLLAAILKSQGYQFGYAPGVGVSHLYADNFQLLDLFIKEFTDGESLFRLEKPGKFCDRFFGSPPEWNEARSLNRPLARIILANLGQLILKREGASYAAIGWQEIIKQWLQFLPLNLLGEKLLLYKYHWLVNFAKLRCYRWWFNEQKMYPAFIDYYMGTTSLCRVKFALKHPPINIQKQLKLSYNIEQISSEDTFGFHAPELYQEKHFRWTSSVAALRCFLQPNDYQITIQLNNARRFTPEKELTIFVNRHRIKTVIFNPHELTLTFEVPKTAFADNLEQWLSFFCEPWMLDGVNLRDPRTLGIPIVSVNFETLSVPESNFIQAMAVG